MKELIIALITLSLSGITFLAYKHPHAYQKLSLPPRIFSMGGELILLGFVWYLGINAAHKTLLPFIPADKQDLALKALETIKIPSSYVLIGVVVWLSLFAYTTFLWFLPRLLKKEV